MASKNKLRGGANAELSCM